MVELGSGLVFEWNWLVRSPVVMVSQFISVSVPKLGRYEPGWMRISLQMLPSTAKMSGLYSSPNSDVSELLNLFYQLSQNDGNVYLLALMYQSCSNSPAGCPAELCAANPVACGLPPTVEPNGETPTPLPTCPAPSVSQASPSLSISPSGPAYPLAVGQDPDKRGADVSGSVSIPPVIFTWYEPVYEEVTSCRAAGPNATTDCTRPNGNPGVTRTGQELKECKAHVEQLPEQINTANARAELSAASRGWIVNDLGSSWYGAYVHQGSFNLTKYGAMNTGCSGGGTCSANLRP